MPEGSGWYNDFAGMAVLFRTGWQMSEMHGEHMEISGPVFVDHDQVAVSFVIILRIAFLIRHRI
jgi:hypothetical protein